MEIDFSEIGLFIRIVTQRTGAPLHDDDLTQDISLRAILAFRKQREVRHPRALLFKIVRDGVHDYWRRRRITCGLDAVDESRVASAPQFEDDIDRRRQAGYLRQALLQMDAGKRATIDQFYTANLSIAEIARLQNKSPSAIKMELVRTRLSLARIVRDLANKKSRG